MPPPPAPPPLSEDSQARSFQTTSSTRWLAAFSTRRLPPTAVRYGEEAGHATPGTGRPPLGPVNGLLYARPGTIFDIVSGNNGYTRRVPALQAKPGYDQASGLGVPRFDALAAALPPPAP